MPDAQARRLWQEHRRVRQPPLLSSSLTGRLLGKHCWSLTAVCSLAPLSVLLSLHYLQVLRVCTAHLSIREMELFPGQMEHEPHQEAQIDDGTQTGGWHWRCLRLYWALPRNKVEFHFSRGVFVANGLMLVAKERWHTKRIAFVL